MVTDEEEQAASEVVTSTLEAIVSFSLKNWASLSWYRTTVLHGLPAGIVPARDAFASYQRAIAFGKMENAPPRLSFEWWLRQVGEQMAAMDEPRALAFLEATGIVFAHSVLDGSVSNLCKLAMSGRPRKTAEILGERLFPLKRLKDATYLNLLGEAIRAKEQSVQRLSLVKRINFLLKHYCPRAPDVSEEPPGFVFDLDRIGRFDKLRNDIVHKESPDAFSIEVHDELQFIQSVDIYLYLRFKANFFTTANA